ncbi:MAG: ORF6N domain-containing protein [Bacilli bacterium]|nr:ORF6N domain-containing protein [Bacilli bacterium]
MNEITEKEYDNIPNMIYEIRGKQVMLDSDLARLYQVETKYFNQAVKRNISRFPSEFMFKLTSEEFSCLRSQFVTSKGRGGRRYLPYVFTEQGVAMLTAVLDSDFAVVTSIRIINAFVAMRHYIGNSLLEQKYINNLVLSHDERITLIEDTLSKLEEKKETNDIFFSGQIFDAYSKIFEIFTSCKNELIIIDNYADNTILNIIKRLKVNVIIITKKDNLITSQDIFKYNKQYHNLRVIFNDTFHDRYFIIDNDIVYHCGASVNRIGYKTFSITKISDSGPVKAIKDNVYKLMK